MRKLSMKQISLIVSGSVFTILLIAVFIILNFTKKNVNVDVLRDKTLVGLITRGSVSDMSWSQSHFDALVRISEELNLEVICRENVTAEGFTDAVRSLADEGCLVVVAASYDYSRYIDECGAEYPEMYFLNTAGTSAGRNTGSYFGRMYQYRYLSGIIAGTRTVTGSIGYVASYPIPEVVRGINAFTLGVRSVNPEAVVHVSYCGTWTDDKAAGDCADKLITGFDADIITMHTDSLAPLDEAEKHGVWSIGYNFDNSDRYKGSYLTGCVWNWDGYYKEQILSCIQRKFRGKNNWLGTESGIMELTDPEKNGNAAPEYKEPLENARQRFEDYSFDVFYGPVTDNEGNIRVGDGESLPDDIMMNSIDWYVEGVEIEG